MTSAGGPADPRRQQPGHDPQPTRSTTDSDAATEGGTGSAFAQLVAGGTFRSPGTRPAAPTGRSGDWNDPDPAAGQVLGEGRTPYDRALDRWKDGTGRDRARSKFRQAARILTGDPELVADEAFLRGYPWHQLSVDDARDFQKAVYKSYSNQATRNDTVCIIRALVRQCYQTKLISALRRELLLEELYTITPGRAKRRHRITDREFDRLMDACLQTGNEFARARNSAIVALFRTTGLRVCELVGADLADWDPREDCLRLRDTKNGDDHVVFLHPGTKALLESWLEVRGTRPGKLFHGARGAITAAIHPSSIRYMLAARCRAAGIEVFGCHDFRRTFATDLLRRFDAALVSKLLNHRKLSSTLIYDLASDDEMRRAVSSISLSPRPADGAA